MTYKYIKNMTITHLVVIVSQGWGVVSPLMLSCPLRLLAPLAPWLLSEAGGGPVCCRHLCRQPSLGLLLLLVSEVLKPSFDLELDTERK